MGSPSRFKPDVSTAATGVAKPRTWLALHEYEVNHIDLEKLRELTRSEWTDKILNEGTKGKITVCNLVKSFGENDLFHGVNV